MSLPIIDISYEKNSGGLDLKSADTSVDEDRASSSLNIDYNKTGGFGSRNGSTVMNSTVIAGNPVSKLLFEYKPSVGSQVLFDFAGDTIYSSFSSPSASLTGLSSANYGDSEEFNTINEDLVFFGDAVNMKKFDGSSWTDWSITSVSTSTLGDTAGALTAGTYSYYMTFARIVGDIVIQESDLSAVMSRTIAGARKIDFTNVPVSADAQVNARIFYRISPNSGGEAYRHVVVKDNVATSFSDNTLSDSSIVDATGTLIDTAYITIDFDKQPIVTSNIFESFLSRMYLVDKDKPSDVYYSPIGQPFYSPSDNVISFDGPVQCIRRNYGSLIFGTDRSTWVLDGDIESFEPRRVSSLFGIMNNRCACGEDVLYILASNKKVYALNPTDFSQKEIRPNNDLSDLVDPIISAIPESTRELPCMEFYSNDANAKVMISIPYQDVSVNDFVVIFNEDQSSALQKPVWELWNNWNLTSIKQFTIDNLTNVYAGDNYGLIWKLDDETATSKADGAAVNGTATAGGASTLTQQNVSSTATAGTVNNLTDSTLTMTTNQYAAFYLTITAGTGSGQTALVSSNTATVFTFSVALGVAPDATSVYRVGPFSPSGLIGRNVYIFDGTGEGQTRKIASNTNVTLTTVTAFTTTPDSTSEFTVGGCNSYHFCNWKSVFFGDGGDRKYNLLKQLWYIYVNAKAEGDYNINMIVQTDFDVSTTNQVEVNVNLSALNSIWGEFIWGESDWGSRTVFEDRFRLFSRFFSIRLGFQSQEAGKSFLINSFGISAQNKQQFFKQAS